MDHTTGYDTTYNKSTAIPPINNNIQQPSPPILSSSAVLAVVSTPGGNGSSSGGGGGNGNGTATTPSSTTTTNTTKSKAVIATMPMTRGHIRSASLENANSFLLKNTLGLPVITNGQTGTLKSRNEQKRLNRFGSHNNIGDYVTQSKSKFQNLRNMFETKFDYEQHQQQQQQQQQPQSLQYFNHLSSHQHLNPNIKLHQLSLQQQQQQHLQQQKNYQSHKHQQQQPHQLQKNHNHNNAQHNMQQTIEFNESLSIVESDRITGQNINHQQPQFHHSPTSIGSTSRRDPATQQQQLSSRRPRIDISEADLPTQPQKKQLLSPTSIGFTNRIESANQHMLAPGQRIDFSDLGLSPLQQQPQLHHQSNNFHENSDLHQNKNVLKPIAFKPIPFEPDYSIPSRYTDLCDRYGSTPSLAPNLGPNMKFGSTSDLRNSNNGYNSYCSNLIARSNSKRCSQSLKFNDSMESVRNTPDSDLNSQNSTIKSNGKYHQHHQNHQHHHQNQDQFDMTPSPSDSGISDLEAALKDRDSELSYLRQTMEHNEKVIFKVHKDKEAYWEQETKRLKIFYENQQREYLLKIKKLEQLLTLQSFQFKQNKLRASENCNRIKEQFQDLKNENQLLRNETEGLRSTDSTMRDRVNQLNEKIDVMDKLIINLKTQLEDIEWTVCQKNGEIALLKTQLKEATMELTHREHEIVLMKNEQHTEEFPTTAPSTTPSVTAALAVVTTSETTVSSNKHEKLNIKPNHNIEMSQLNRIIILKDQVILALTNELGKLRKELSDLAILHEYGEEPAGKYTRLKYQIENLSGICCNNNTTLNSISTITNHKNNLKIPPKNEPNSNPLCMTTKTTAPPTTQKTYEENDLEIIINCLKSGIKIIDENHPEFQDHFIKSKFTTRNNNKSPNLPDVTQNSIDQIDDINNNKKKNSNINSNNNLNIQENDALQREFNEAKRTFDIEKHQWAEEKEKVLKYQRQLQINYINMYQKMKELEIQLAAAAAAAANNTSAAPAGGGGGAAASSSK